MADPIRRAGPREEGGVAVRRATTAIPHIRAGRLRAIGYTGSQRFPELPDVPTVAEAVAPGFLYESSWQGIFAPAGTPPAILNRIQNEVAAVARNPKLRDVWAAGGHFVVASTPEEFGRFLRTYLQENAGAASDRRRSASVVTRRVAESGAYTWQCGASRVVLHIAAGLRVVRIRDRTRDDGRLGRQARRCASNRLEDA